ncbi:MAG: hypothetical protein H3C26_05435 [Rhodocyclaceae bacterium]|nr:hypothetical protein [Rhodocyclaceae bacterium]
MASTNACRRADPRRSGGRLLAAASLAVLLAACAAPPSPRIDRLPVAGAPAAASLSADEIVRLAAAGAAPEAVVGRWREDGARLRPTAALLLDLHARGVPLPVLEALVDAREAALRTDADGRLAALQARLDAELAAERARPRVCPSYPLHPYPYPYGGWHAPGGWRGGLYWGW